jgi:hypothetical protein
MAWYEVHTVLFAQFAAATAETHPGSSSENLGYYRTKSLKKFLDSP